MASGAKNCLKRIKWWLSAFLLFSQCLLSQAFFPTVFKTWDCVVKGWNAEYNTMTFLVWNKTCTCNYNFMLLLSTVFQQSGQCRPKIRVQICAFWSYSTLATMIHLFVKGAVRFSISQVWTSGLKIKQIDPIPGNETNFSQIKNLYRW